MNTIIPDQFELDSKKYSLLHIYQRKEFLHAFIDGKIPSTSAFVIYGADKDRPSVPVFYNTVCEELEMLFRYYNDDAKIAEYERMPPLNYPERVCGNCKHFCRHYSGSDNSLGLAILDEGHCMGRRSAFKRMRLDSPKDGCFEWNAECVGIIDKIEERAKRAYESDTKHLR